MQTPEIPEPTFGGPFFSLCPARLCHACFAGCSMAPTTTRSNLVHLRAFTFSISGGARGFTRSLRRKPTSQSAAAHAAGRLHVVPVRPELRTMAEVPPPLWHGLAAGGAAAVASRIVTYPPDTLKARLQVQGSGTAVQYRGTVDAFLTIAKAEGVPGFYRGFGAILASVVPANMCYFGGYEMGKRLAPKNMGMLSDMATASIAQTIAGIAFNPIDVIKQRLQTEGVRKGRSASAVQVVQEVYQNQGLPGFWKGFVTMNALWLPWNLIYLSLYEGSKRRLYYHYLQRRRGEEGQRGGGGSSNGGSLSGGPQEVVSRTPQGVSVYHDPPMHEALPLWAFPLCSGACSATACVFTHPIDVVKTRLQVLSTGANGQQLSAWQVARQLWRQEGLRGFRRGMAARVLTMASGSAVSWSTYETVKKQLAHWGRGN